VTVFGTGRVLQEISERLAAMDARTTGALREISGTLQRMDARTTGALKEISGTLQRMDARIERESKLTRAAIENNTQVTRQILLEVREHRPILEHIDHGVQANTDGLMHVLDELRNGRGGPGTAPAA
jgi:hypothetical protein